MVWSVMCLHNFVLYFIFHLFSVNCQNNISYVHLSFLIQFLYFYLISYFRLRCLRLRWSEVMSIVGVYFVRMTAFHFT